jgi:ABC-type branched-subunit amino acid transport system substrate-binding protein
MTGRGWAALAAGAALAGAGCSPPAEPPGNAIPVGVLLPFTGDFTSSGNDFERALMMGVEEINAAGGVAGRPIRLKTLDTRSDLVRGRQAAQRLIDAGVRVIIGPEEADISLSIADLLAEAAVTNLLPSITAPRTSEPVEEGPASRFRLAPSAEVTGCTLALKTLADRASPVVILATGDVYHQSLARTYADTLAADPSVQVTSYALPAKWAVVQEIIAGNPQAVALFAPPRVASDTVTSFFAARAEHRITWYLAPQLRDESFLFGTSAAAVEGAVGLSPALDLTRSDKFIAAFKARWHGEAPMIGAAYYFDAINLAALAMSAAMRGQDRELGDVAPFVSPVSFSIGWIIDWKNIEEGLLLTSRGSAINYTGVSGAVDLTPEGELTHTPAMQLWTIRQGRYELSDRLARCIVTR